MNRRLFLKGATLQTFTILPFSHVMRSFYLIRSYNYVRKGDMDYIQDLLDTKKPVTWLFTGDSIAQGAKHTNGMRSFSEIFGERVRWEMSRGYDTIINTAISGNTTENLLSEFELRVAKYKPDIVFLMIGTNDAAIMKDISIDKFGENVGLFIAHVRSLKGIPVLLTPNKIDLEKSQERPRIEEYVTKMRQVAYAKNTVLVDIWKLWENELYEKYNGNVNEMLMSDILHPDGHGHKEIAMALFRSLSIFDPLSPSCKDECLLNNF
ncbi:MAG: SGNH/GDSL hydrolase family protein [Fermentimonas sp.]|nr:SGNH/GDSL hydrolase family protein [Fermentimonas sp.]